MDLYGQTPSNGYEIVEVFKEVLSGGAVERPAMRSLTAYFQALKDA